MLGACWNVCRWVPGLWDSQVFITIVLFAVIPQVHADTAMGRSAVAPAFSTCREMHRVNHVIHLCPAPHPALPSLAMPTQPSQLLPPGLEAGLPAFFGTAPLLCLHFWIEHVLPLILGLLAQIKHSSCS